MAVAYIDYFKHCSRASDQSLKKILERFYTYYPKFISNQAYLTPADRMTMLINSARKSEVVECLAYVFQQMAVDEVYAHPLEYREIFAGMDANESKAVLRQAGTVFPPSVLGALSHALGISIVLSVIENGKELRQRTLFSCNSTGMFKAELELQLNGENYFPRVKNEADYAYVGQLAIKPPAPAASEEFSSETLAEIVGLIQADNKQILRTYDQWKKNLLMEGLTKKQLVALYIKFLPEHSTIIHDCREFFSRLKASNSLVVRVDTRNNEEYIKDALAGSLAEWISLNQIDPDRLMDYIEKPVVEAASPAA
ncbi:hypothetical protein [Legionella worsleiensis]|uniref:Uncharacterized protein n=1 Tax=Legionella worsleiensis TaxID=45076 RepID=A0A0W1AF01_9GAMM|nr:hypothetical protein [Legionella worsleiensis]KTD79731.1 hypothetical protein Lwor_1245 [Legionella worsleiensis]STY32242.1 Uncharacterised protein [Legionella worsleiensis]